MKRSKSGGITASDFCQAFKLNGHIPFVVEFD